MPVSSIGGWYDIFLPGQLRDFQVLQSLGPPARLTVGPWTHLSMDGTPMREAVEFGLAYARGVEPPPRPPVRLYVMGDERVARLRVLAAARLLADPPAPARRRHAVRG